MVERNPEILRRILSEKLLWSVQTEVYRTLFSYGPMTAAEIKVKTQNNKIANRISELVKLKAVNRLEKVTCPVTKRQVFLFDISGELPVKYEKPKTKTQRLREAETRLIEAEKAMTRCQALIPLTKGERELLKYREQYPEQYKYTSLKG